MPNAYHSFKATLIGHGISRNTQSKCYMLSFSECVWDFQNNTLWDTQKHAVLTCILFLPAFFNSCDAFLSILADFVAAPLVLLSLQNKADPVIQQGSTKKRERILNLKETLIIKQLTISLRLILRFSPDTSYPLSTVSYNYCNRRRKEIVISLDWTKSSKFHWIEVV